MTMRPDDIRFWLLLWLVVSASTTWGLLAIWAALSRRHWFARTAVLIGGAWALALVPAYDLVIGFATEAVCIVPPLLIWRGWRAVATQRGVRAILSGMRFRLIDILLVTAGCAAVAALVGRLPIELQETWATHAMWGAACGCTVTAACCALLGGRTLILTAVTPLVAALLPSQEQDPLVVMMLANPPCLYDWGWSGWAWYPALALLAVSTVIWLFLFRALGRRLRKERPTPKVWLVRASQYALAALSTIIIAPSLLAYWQMMTPTPKPTVRLPSPNGYDELKRIGAALADSVPDDIDTATEAELRTFVAKHGLDLRDVRIALIHESVVPLKYTPEDIDDITTIRNVYRALWARARIAEFDGRCDDAGDDYLLIMHVGEKSARGGLNINWFIGSGALSRGLDGLSRLRATLSGSQLQKACAEVTAIQSRFERLQDAVARDQVWMEHAYGWPNRVRFLREPPERLYEQLDAYHRAERCLVQCDLATRLYRRDHSRWPESLNELVPDYLETLPEDPYTKRSFVYRRKGGDFLLYSTGPDKTDNGGVRTTPVGFPPDGEDITLEPPMTQGPCSCAG